MTSSRQASQQLLEHAVSILHDRNHVHGWCLGYVREAVEAVGLKLPPRRDKPNNTALWNGQHLKADPSAYRWQLAARDERYALTYFDNCARLSDGRVAGHIAIHDRETGVLYSCDEYTWSPFWSSRVYAAFVPAYDHPAVVAASSPSSSGRATLRRGSFKLFNVVDGEELVRDPHGAVVLLDSDGKHSGVLVSALSAGLAKLGIVLAADDPEGGGDLLARIAVPVAVQRTEPTADPPAPSPAVFSDTRSA